MYVTSRPERRRAVGGLLLSMALTSFLTGVTEPIEFAFMFLAPVLYAVHAVLTGVAMVLMHALQVRLGFGFSAGLFDYVLNFRLADRPLWLLPIGVAYFLAYFALFRWAILRWDLRTPGREPLDAATANTGDDAVAPHGVTAGADFVQALGGAANLRSVDACTTRLRLEVADQARVDEAALRRLGAHGLVRPSDTVLQVVLGPVADQVAEQIRRHIKDIGSGEFTTSRTAIGHEKTFDVVPPVVDAELDDGLLRAFGGRHNVEGIARVARTRLRVQVREDAAVDASAVIAAAPRGAVRVAPGRWHVLVAP
jgi:PTS system N-acetylglucosamine-specific IIC component